MTEPLDCKVVLTGEPYVGKQGFNYLPALSAETVGARGIHMQLLTIPPGARARAHKHEGHETAIYAISGISTMYYGERLEKEMTIRAGEFLYIPANMPHLPFNPSLTEPAVAVIARTDPNEQESVILLPELEALRFPKG